MRRALLIKYIKLRLREPSTYWVAFIVGTMINLYGHILVPYMRGESDVVAAFTDHARAAPTELIVSMVLAYCFPMCVGVYSAATTRLGQQAVEDRASFPDLKPDPVFCARRNGEIIDAGSRTSHLFAERQITCAQALLGEQVWNTIVERTSRGEPMPAGTRVRALELNRWFVVTAAPAREDAVNVYMTETSAPSGEQAAH